MILQASPGLVLHQNPEDRDGSPCEKRRYGGQYHYLPPRQASAFSAALAPDIDEFHAERH